MAGDLVQGDLAVDGGGILSGGHETPGGSRLGHPQLPGSGRARLLLIHDGLGRGGTRLRSGRRRGGETVSHCTGGGKLATGQAPSRHPAGKLHRNAYAARNIPRRHTHSGWTGKDEFGASTLTPGPSNVSVRKPLTRRYKRIPPGSRLDILPLIFQWAKQCTLSVRDVPLRSRALSTPYALILSFIRSLPRARGAGKRSITGSLAKPNQGSPSELGAGSGHARRTTELRRKAS